MTDRTHPWHRDEMAVVSGVRCVYTIDKDGPMLIRLPGGRAATVAELRAEGHDVELPKLVRTDA